MSTDVEIKSAEFELQHLQDAVGTAQKKLNDLYIRRSKEVHGIEVGMRVRTKRGEFIVVEIAPESWRSKPWLTGNPIKKDGTAGAARRNLFGDWEIVGRTLKP